VISVDRSIVDDRSTIDQPVLIRRFFDFSKTYDPNPCARIAPALARFQRQPRGFPSRGTTPAAVAEQEEELVSEPLTEQVIENDVDGRVEGDEKVSHLVQGV